MIFSSTIVNYGSATGVVVFTGMKTAIGRVQKQVSEAAEEEEDTPLKKKLDDFGEKLSYLISIVCLLVWVMNYNNFYDEIHGGFVKGCIYYFKIAIALAVAAIPEGLPAVITTCLALGTRKMAKNNAIVRRLPSVETLGCTTVICSDKTGTLTKNEMCAISFAVIDDSSSSLKEYKVPVGTVGSDESSYSPINLSKKISAVGGSEQTWMSDLRKNADLFESLATGCTLNNSARIDFVEGNYKRVGEPTEAALKVLAEKMVGAPLDNKSAFDFEKKMNGKLKTIATLDFTSQRKAMSTIVSGYKNDKDTLLKGAPDRIIEKCTKYMSLNGGTKEMAASDRQAILKNVAALAAQGLRCLAIAEIPNAGELSNLTEANKTALLSDISTYNKYEQGATFIGIVCIKDPVRPEIKSSIADCKTAGIRVIMITGDSRETAMAIAQEINILEKHDDPKTSVFTGTEFQNMSAAEKKKAVGGEGGKVFSRVEPAHKRELVKILIELGQIVAMTGDGVNDAPALK